MTEKEKAKAYDEALEKASAAHKDEDRHLKATLERIFPELKESEDERIKKAIIEFFESEDDNATYSLVRKKDIIAWLEKQGKEEYALKSFKDEDVRKFMQYIEKLAKVYEFNLPNRSYDIYAFAKDLLVWLEKQGEKASLQTNELAWLYLVSDVLTWKDGIGQYLDDPRVQELAKRLCSEYAQKLYNPSNTVKNEQKSADKVEPRFKVGDWVIFTTSERVYQVEKKENYEYTLRDINGRSFCVSFSNEELVREWTIQDAKDGDVIQLGKVTAIFRKYIGREKCICYCSFCKNGGFEIPIENGEDNVYGCHNAAPATREQHNVLMNAMNNAGYEWDIKKKELKKKHKS